MTRKQIVLCFAAVLIAVAIATGAGADEATKSGARPEVGKPIQAAVDLLKQKRGRDALAKVREAQAVGNRTAYENFIVEQVLGQAAAAAGDPATAARAFENVADMAAAPDGQRSQFLAAAAGQYYAAKEYAKAADVAARYLKNGGADKPLRTIYVQSLYLGGNYAAAAKELSNEIEADERSGRSPPEDQLQLLVNAYSQQKDVAGYARAMEKLVAYHPKKEYWLAVVHSAATRPGVSDRLALDLARLKLATGTMRSMNEYLEAAQLSLQAGYPAEATKIIEKGYSVGLLGTGADAERHKRLKDMAARNLAEDRKTLEQEAAQSAANNNSVALLNNGLNLVFNGRAEKGLPMMEQAIRAGGMKRPEDARLHLGFAYHVAGQNQKAVNTFKAVQGGDGAAALARLWVLRLSRNS